MKATDSLLSALGLGCEQLGGTDWGPFDERQAVAAVRRALEVGINVFDTADVYGLGRSEILLAEALGRHRHDVIIVSKGGIRWEKPNGAGRAVTFRDSRPGYLTEAVEKSLRRLKLETIPIYLVHWPDPETPIEDTVAALCKLKQQGKITHFGISNFDSSLIRRACQSGPISVIEHPYSLVHRTTERGIFPIAEELRLIVLVYGVLAQGLLTGKYNWQTTFCSTDRRSRLAHFQEQNWTCFERLLRKIQTIAARYGKSVAQTAIRWVLENETVTCAVVGAKSPQQVDANVGALGWQLDEADLHELATALDPIEQA